MKITSVGAPPPDPDRNRLIQRLLDRPRLFVSRQEAAHLVDTSPRAISRAWKTGELPRHQAPGATGPKGYRVYVPDLFPAPTGKEGEK
ncbi:MAG: hypothetical protein H8E31_09840 [Planctomycetes bacterium]|nr:hypothetical protein [Planctomycetota bacterium]